MTLLWTIAVAILVAVIAVIVAVPQPELKWDETVLPMARKYAGTYSNNDRPLNGKIVLVTGSTSGIGLSLVKAFTKLGAHVIGVGRSESKLQALKAEFPTVDTVQADFSDLEDVSQIVNKLYKLRSINRVDILINNAGIVGPANFTSPQGFDHVFTVNYLSHFLLTEKLSRLLRKSADPTVIQISSSYHWQVDGSDLIPGATQSDFPVAARPGGSRGFYIWRIHRAYANSKLAQIYHARVLAKKNKALSRVRTVSVCPSWVGTKIGSSDGAFAHRFLTLAGFPVDGWGLASVFTALFSRDNEGDYYTNSVLLKPFMPVVSYLPYKRLAANATSARSSPESYNEDIANALYDWSYKAVAKYI